MSDQTKTTSITPNFTSENLLSILQTKHDGQTTTTSVISTRRQEKKKFAPVVITS